MLGVTSNSKNRLKHAPPDYQRRGAPNLEQKQKKRRGEISYSGGKIYFLPGLVGDRVLDLAAGTHAERDMRKEGGGKEGYGG